MGLWLLLITCIAAAGISACAVRWYMGRARVRDRRRLLRVSCVSTVLCLGVFAASFVLLLVLLADMNDTAGDATIHAVQSLERWLRHTLRP